MRTPQQRIADRLVGDIYALDADQAAFVATAAADAWEDYDPAQHEGRPGSRRHTVTIAIDRAVREATGTNYRDEVLDDVFDLVRVSYAEYATARSLGLRS